MRNTGELYFLLCGVNAAVEISPALAGSLPSAAKKKPRKPDLRSPSEIAAF
ncbi:MAG: hypothetical protein II922_10110 [Succinimonas sp.]|nr:hypothetical protein [Succinimonas sp.]MEE3422018.1 hypothetical protein [Succinimonas sp.]